MARGRPFRHSGAMPDALPNAVEHEEGNDNSMPEPPPNWPPISNARNSSSLGSLHNDNQLEDQDEDLTDSDDTETQNRGPTLMNTEGWGADGRILEIETNKFGQPIEEKASRLASNLGVLARNGIMAPLHYVDWRLLPKLNKDNLWKTIKDNTNATDNMRQVLMMSLGRKWKEWKHEAKSQGFDKYNTTEERLAHCPPRVDESQWRRLVFHWSTTEAKERSVKNQASRTKLTVPHHLGRKSSAQAANELKKEKGGVSPTRREIYKKLYLPKGDKPVHEEAAKAIEEMDRIALEHPESPDISANDIFSQVMGPEKSGRVRPLGLGVAPSKVFGSMSRRQCNYQDVTNTHIQSQLDTLRAEMELSSQQELERVRAESQKELDQVRAELQASSQQELDRVRAALEVSQHALTEIRGEMEQMDAHVNAKVQSQVKEQLAIMGKAFDAKMKALEDHLSSEGVRSVTGQVPDNSSGTSPLKQLSQNQEPRKPRYKLLKNLSSNDNTSYEVHPVKKSRK